MGNAKSIKAKVLGVVVAVILAAGIMPAFGFATGQDTEENFDCTCETLCTDTTAASCSACALDVSNCKGALANQAEEGDAKGAAAISTTSVVKEEESVNQEEPASNAKEASDVQIGLAANIAACKDLASLDALLKSLDESYEFTDEDQAAIYERLQAADFDWGGDASLIAYYKALIPEELTTKEIKYLDENGQEQEVTATAIPLSTSAKQFVFSQDGWYFVDATEATFSKNWQIDANVNIILLDNQKIYFDSGANIDIYKDRNGSITFYSQSRGESEGYLKVISSDNPGIGNNKASGDITFNGGRFDLGDSSISPAIGGKQNESNYPNITINAGTLNFTHKAESYDAINAGTNGTVTITGGTLNFADRSTKSQINTGTLTITGGTVNCGNVESNVNITAAQSITISGGTVYATRGSESDGTAATAIYSGGSFSTGSNGTAHITTTKLEAANGTDTSTWSCIYTQVSKPDGVEILGTKVYGHQTLSGNITIAENEIFTVPNGAKVTIPADATLTNNGSLIIAGYAVAEKAASVRMSSTATLSGVIETQDNRMILIPQVVATSKTYDGTTQVDFTIKFAGLPQSASSLTMNQDYSAKAAFADANAGENKEVSASVDLLANSNTSNYVLSSNVATTTAAINKAPITPSATAEDKAYNGTTKAKATVSFKGLLNGDVLEEGTDYEVSAEFDSADAGTGKYVTVAVTLKDTEKANNYVLNPVKDTTTASIFRATYCTPSDDFHVYCLDFIGETIAYDSIRYEINSSADFNGNVISEGSWIAPGSILYLRVKEDMNHEVSQALQINIDTRPAAPAGLEAVAESSKGSNDGKITGLTSGMEYKAEDDDAWTAVMGDSIGGLAPGTYYVRYKATNSSFASEVVFLTVQSSSTVVETAEDGSTVATTYDEDGNKIKQVVTGVSGNSTTTEYDANGNVVTVIEKDTAGTTTTTEYGENNTKVVTCTDEMGVITDRRTYAADGSYVKDGFEPTLIEGNGSTYNKQDAMIFRSNDELVNFLDVLVDGAKLDASSYEVESGSIKATLSTTYLNTLESGTHTLQIQSTNGNAEGTFTIPAAESLDNPDKDPVEDPDEGSAKDPAKDPDEGLDEDPTEDPAENPGDNSLKTPESDNDEKLKVDNNSKDSNQQNLASNENQSANESQDASEEDLANTGDTTAATILLLLGCLCAAAVTVRYARTRKN